MKRCVVLLALVMALGIMIPLAAGPIDTGPPVMLALSSTVTPFEMPAVRSNAVATSIESTAVDFYVSQLDLEPVLAGLMRGVALSMLLLVGAFIAKDIRLSYDPRSRFIRFARDQCTAS